MYEFEIVDKTIEYLEKILQENNMQYTETLHDLFINEFMGIAETQYRKSLGKLK